MRVCLTPSGIGGTVTAPPSKSMAHRALICAALAEGESLLSNVAPSQDILATWGALCALGAQIQQEKDGRVRVRGVGGRRLTVPAAPVDCGESGSTLRFLIPFFARTGAPVRLWGRGRLPARPQSVYAELFARQGLRFEQDAAGITLCGPLRPGEYAVDGGVSSQFISGLLFSLPLLDGPSRVQIRPPFESRSYVQLTRQAMGDFGVQTMWENEYTIYIEKSKYTKCDYCVEGDYSQAAFFAVLGALKGGVTVQGLRPDSLQGDRAVLDILRRCGAVFHSVPGGYAFEKSALHAVRIDLADCPDLGPILMVLGLFCEGETVIRNAQRLRMKESDRIAAMEQEAAKLGGRIESEGGTVRVRRAPLHGAQGLSSHNDHRIAMALAVAALGADVPAKLDGAEAVNKSYPEFWRDLAALGAKVEQDETA